MSPNRDTVSTIIVLLAVLSGITFWGRPLHDYDLGWHLVGGAWIVKHKALPWFDFVNTFNETWHDYHWFGQILLYGTYALGGYGLLKVAYGIVMAFLFKVVADIARISANSERPPAGVFLLMGASMLLIAVPATIRPQTLAFLVLSLTLRRMLGDRRVREAAYVGVLAVFLANVHVFWLFVPVLWCLYRSVPAMVERREGRFRDLLVLALLCCSGLVSPYPLKNYALLAEYATMPAFLAGHIDELQSTFANRDISFWIVTGYLVTAVVVFRPRRVRSLIADHLLFVLGIVLAASAFRFTPLTALFSLPFLTRGLAAMVRRRSPDSRWSGALVKGITGSLAVLTLAGAVYGFPRSAEREETAVRSLFPIEACTSIVRSIPNGMAERSHARVLTPFSYGGWCRWAMFEADPAADVRVTTDGRTQWVRGSLYEDSDVVYRTGEHWRELLRSWDPDAALVPRWARLSDAMLVLDGWNMIFQDRNFRAFVRVRR